MRPPPIQEAWKIDERGRLVSTPWILWLQEISGGTSSTPSTGGGGGTSQTIIINNTTYDLGTIINEVGMYAEFGDVDSSSSFTPVYLTDADVFLDSATTTSTGTDVNLDSATSYSTGVNDAELFCWMSY